MDLGTGLGSGAAGSLQPDPVASLSHGKGRAALKRVCGEGDGCWGGGGSRWGARLVPETPCSWRRRGDRCSQPGSVGMLPNPGANPPRQLRVSQSGDFLPVFLAQAGPRKVHPSATHVSGGRMEPGTFGCPGHGFGTGHRQGGWRWDPRLGAAAARMGADPLNTSSLNLPALGTI